MPPQAPITRLAPSPTGALHLGNARTFLVNWAMARQAGWRIVLRIEDLDGPRVKPGVIDASIDTLRWLGIDWDTGPIIQSHDPMPHIEAMRHLAAHALVFPSELSRAEIETAASAPQEGSHEVRCPASMRPPLVPIDFADTGTNWRFATPKEVVRVDDNFTGPREFTPSETIGDFIVWTKRGTPSYQLAVVVDDHRQGVTHIVRGDDLLESAARQALLYRALGYAPIPAYWHLPLVLGGDGRRLAKRHGDTRLDTYRDRGVTADRVIGLIAAWCGIVDSPTPMSPREFQAAMDVRRIPRNPVMFTMEDDRWLLADSR
ncbi:MAG: tRNA glutamyl-Q(34) synthetase GluQRS [Phycisphaerales bacterium]|nr:MAG: tRNA glutamyl-Q(34) synthetase GluQRS [Phycisphaerales bacterium]